jgi:hypothetical protein
VIAPAFVAHAVPMPPTDRDRGRGLLLLLLLAACIDRVRFCRTDGENRHMVARRLDGC